MSIPSKPRVTAGAAVMALMCAALLVASASPVLAAQQSGAGGEEVARVRAELRARLEHINQQLMEQMSRIGSLNEAELQSLQAQLEALQVNEEHIRQAVAESLQRAGAVQERASVEAMARYQQELQRARAAQERALVSARQAMERARVGMVRLRSGCGVFGEAVLDLADELSLTDEQVGQIREAQRSARRASIGRNADIEVGQMDLEALYEADQPDLAAIRAKLEELAMLGVDEQMSGLQLREQVRAILTPEQREQLEDLRSGDVMDIVVPGAGTGRYATLRLDRITC